MFPQSYLPDDNGFRIDSDTASACGGGNPIPLFHEPARSEDIGAGIDSLPNQVCTRAAAYVQPPASSLARCQMG